MVLKVVNATEENKASHEDHRQGCIENRGWKQGTPVKVISKPSRGQGNRHKCWCLTGVPKENGGI